MMEQKTVTYSDELGNRRREAWALIVGPGDEIELFSGKSIPGKVAVIGRDYKKQGVWSHNTYRLQLAPGVRFISGHMGWETGSFPEGLRDATGKPTDRWHEIANALGVSLPVAQAFLREWLPKRSELLDKVESDLASLDETSPEEEEEKMKKIINTTPHSITMQDADGHIYTVEPCGVLISARPVEEAAGVHPSGAELVRTRFEADPASEEALAKLEKENPDAVIVGSIIAAQAFPGRVLAMVPAPGFERVPPAEKRMRDDKFTTF